MAAERTYTVRLRYRPFDDPTMGPEAEWTETVTGLTPLDAEGKAWTRMTQDRERRQAVFLGSVIEEIE